MILNAAYSAGLSSMALTSYFFDSLFFSYWVILFASFASTVSLPAMTRKYRNLIWFWQRRCAVDPQILPLTRSKGDQTPAGVRAIR